jgi:hypothetical protein
VLTLTDHVVLLVDHMCARMPQLVTLGFHVVPSEPPFDHLPGDPGHFRQHGYEKLPVVESGEPVLQGQIAGLEELVGFDEQGLYRAEDVCFSRFGSLLNTAEHFVVHSSAGYYASELSRELAVETKEALLTLVRRQRVARTRVDGLYLHCSPDPQIRRDQLMHREQGIELPGAATAKRAVEISEEARAAVILFFSTLNERQRRLYAGMESLRVGYGGDRRIAELTGLDVHTVARGRRELFAGELEEQALRSKGGGRVPVEKKRQK